MNNNNTENIQQYTIIKLCECGLSLSQNILLDGPHLSCDNVR